MKSLLRNTIINALSLYFLALIFSGVQVVGGLATYLIGGFVLSIMFNVLKPIIGILSLPLNILTLGTFSFLINVLIFYIATQLIPGLSIKGFIYPGIVVSGFVIPRIALNTFFAYIAAAFAQSILVSFFSWLRK